MHVLMGQVLLTATVTGPDGWTLAYSVLGVLATVAGIDLGIAFLLRGSREAVPDDRD